MVIQFWFADDNTIPELVIMKKDAFKKFFSSRRGVALPAGASTDATGAYTPVGRSRPASGQWWTVLSVCLGGSIALGITILPHLLTLADEEIQ